MSRVPDRVSREEIIEYLRTGSRKSVRAKVLRQKYTRLAILTFLFVLVLLGLVYFLGIHRAKAGGLPTCEIQFTQDFNQVAFTATWSGGTPDGEYPFEFGDASPADVLTGTVGQKVLPHDYGWTVGDIVTYTAGFTVTDAPEGTPAHCEQQVVIDDRPGEPTPELTEKIYLPVAFNQRATPSVSLDPVVGSQWNRVTVKLAWSGANDEWHTLQFGDGSSTDVFGSFGNQEVAHDYTWPGGQFTLTFTVNGPGGSTVVTDTVTLTAP